MKKLIFISIILSWSVYAQEIQAPRNIILMIGDGMGVGQVTAGRTYKGSLALEEFKYVGLVLTHAHGHYVTDSGAGATALASGVSTYNGAIGVGPDSTARETILERARKIGKKTGLVATSSITHATPASFAAHVTSRDQETEIAAQLARSEVDVLFGGGWGWFLPKSDGGRREDGMNLLGHLRNIGYTVVRTAEEFRSIEDRDSKVAGFLAENHLGPAQERPVTLRQMTEKALALLAGSEAGFFLMVEGSQIDWAGHDNNGDQVLLEMADFDDAIAAVSAFADAHPGTLVVVTADHETGGIGLVGGSLEQKSVVARFVGSDHTAAMVPLFAKGPGAGLLTGIRTNADIGRTLLKLWQ